MFRRAGITPVATFAVCLSTLTLGCVPGPTQSIGSIGPSKGEIVAAAVGVVAGVAVITTVVVVEVHNHHTVKGCLINGPNGMQIQESNDAKTTYALEHAPAELKVGDLVRLHGDRGPKVERGGIRSFKVTEIKKTYGACPAVASVKPPTAPQP